MISIAISGNAIPCDEKWQFWRDRKMLGSHVYVPHCDNFTKAALFPLSTHHGRTAHLWYHKEEAKFGSLLPVRYTTLDYDLFTK